jgi:hypothetical protein
VLRLLVAVAFVSSASLAHAGFKATPPEGWTASTAEELAPISEAVRKAYSNVVFEVRQWKQSGTIRQFTVMNFATPNPEPPKLTDEEFVDHTADAAVKSQVASGAKLVRSLAAHRVKGQLVAERVVRLDDNRLYVIVRMLGTGARAFQLLTATCVDKSDATCKKAIASVTLTP